MADVTSDSKGDRRLSSWKEIAAYFGKDERTVKRWEQRGLPVRRVPKGTRSSVFAYQSELEDWLRGPPRAEPAAALAAAPASAAAIPAGVAPPAPRPRRLLQTAAVIVSAMLGAGIAAYVTPQWLNPPAPVASSFVPSAEAQALYREGVIAWNSRTAEGFQRAIERFEGALAHDAGYAAAYAGLANVYNLLSQYTDAPAAEAYAKAAEYADRALALDPELPEAYAAKGFNLFYGQHDFARSAEMFEAALKRAPDSAQTLHWSALTGMHLGRFERPLALIDRAMALMPESRSIRANRALITFHAGRADDAIAQLKTLKQAEPDYLGTPSYLATIYFALGRYREFIAEYEEAARVSRSEPRQRIAAAARRGFADGGGPGLLTAMYAAQQREFATGGEPAFKLAITAAVLGEDAAALGYLEQSAMRGEPDILSLRIEEAFGRLRQEPRYLALLDQVGLPRP